MAQADVLRAIMDSEFRTQFMKENNLSEAELSVLLETAAHESSPHFGVI